MYLAYKYQKFIEQGKKLYVAEYMSSATPMYEYVNFKGTQFCSQLLLAFIIGVSPSRQLIPRECPLRNFRNTLIKAKTISSLIIIRSRWVDTSRSTISTRLRRIEKHFLKWCKYCPQASTTIVPFNYRVFASWNSDCTVLNRRICTDSYISARIS